MARFIKQAFLLRLVILSLLSLVLSGCLGASNERNDLPIPSADENAVGSCAVVSEWDETEEQQIWALLSSEAQLVVSQDIDRLLLLWDEQAEITDARNSPFDSSDDQTWFGLDAIRYRYVRSVFPSAPAKAEIADLDISIQGDRAIVTATTQIGDEVSLRGDRWELVKRDDCWLIKSLIYNLEVAEE